MNEELARRAKQYAARTDRTFTQVVEEAVMELLAKPTQPSKPREPIVLPTSGTAGGRPITEEELKAIIERDYEEEAERIWKAGHEPDRR